MKIKNESGIALIAALLILVLMGVMLEVFIVSVNSSQKMLAEDFQSDRTFAGAYAALNSITQEMADLLSSNALNPTTIQNLMEQPFSITNKVLETDEHGNSVLVDHEGNRITIASPKITVGAESPMRTITQGALAGLWANITSYYISVTARATTGEVVTLEREVQVASIPVFQFGVFSESDLEFSAGADFDFGGRVHTNGNLHLLSGGASSPNAILKLVDRVSAVGKILRKSQMNGRAYNADSADMKAGPVSMARPPSYAGPRNLGQEEGNDGKTDAEWETYVYSQYEGYLRNGKTGAMRMELPLVSGGLKPYEIIHRSEKDENISDPVVFEQRFSSNAGLRILLSDTEDEIRDIPGVDWTPSTRPVLLQTAGDYVFAESSNTTDFNLNGSPAAGAPLIGGYIKIEMRTANSLLSWKDITKEILNYGYTGASTDATPTCANAYPDAIIRIQRFRENLPTTQTNNAANCLSAASNAQNLWSNALFDSREGTPDNTKITNMNNLYLGGIMHYVELDIANLGKWIRRESGSIYAGGSGNQVYREETGYVVYFSDRRGSRNKYARYMYENSKQDTDGDGVARYNGSDIPAASLTIRKESTGGIYTSNITAASPLSTVGTDVARRTSPLYFRRALKLVNGGKIELGVNTYTNVPYGLTLAAENPVYVQGNYNANATVFNDVAVGKCTGACEFKQGNHSVPAAVIADAVTLLSNNWKDRASFNSPYVTSGGERIGTTTHYRMAIISGKNKPFSYTTGVVSDSVTVSEWGSDGGVHNFLRMLEYWSNTGVTMFYNGSMVSLFYGQQANAAFKFRRTENIVYSEPIRRFYFDNEYTDVDKLPPRTPMLRSISVLSFSRITGVNR